MVAPSPRSFVSTLWVLGLLLLVEWFQRGVPEFQITVSCQATNVDKLVMGNSSTRETLNNLRVELDLTSLQNQTGSWIGHHWVPPCRWHEFSASEMQQLYQDTDTL